MEKYGNKKPVAKFFHKNTGFIVAGAVIVIIASLWFYTTSNQEFFESWSCAELQRYVLTFDQDIYNEDFPDHEHLTEEQHERFHQVIAECDFIFEHK